MFLNEGMDKEIVVHLNNGVLLNFKQNDIMKFADKWMELKKKNKPWVPRKTNMVSIH